MGSTKDAHRVLATTALPRFRMLGTVTLLLCLHPLAGYLYLPALPRLREAFGASAQAAQWTLSAFVVGFGLTQLAWGVLGDKHGRRPVLLIGLGVFLAAAIGCLMATDIAQVVVWRALQGAGAAAAGVSARAMLRDLYRPSESIRMLSIGFSGLSVVSIAAPLCGASVVALRGAGGCFELLALVGVAALAYVALALPETAPTRGSPCGGGDPWSLSVRRIACDRLFRAYTALTACTYTGHYLFLAGSSFLLIEREGLGVFGYGVVLSIGSFVHMAGTFACRQWLRRHDVRATVAHAAVLTLVGGSAMALLALAGVTAPWAVIAPQWLYVFAHAVHQSCGQAAVMAPFPRLAGTAAALLGTVLPVVAVGVASLLATPLSHSALALPLGVGACAMLTAAVAWTLVRRDGALPNNAPSCRNT